MTTKTTKQLTDVIERCKKDVVSKYMEAAGKIARVNRTLGNGDVLTAAELQEMASTLEVNDAICDVLDRFVTYAYTMETLVKELETEQQ